jgi:hypothetical protein
MLKNRKNFESTLEAQLAQWKADLDVLKAKATRAKVGAMVQYDQGIDALQAKHDEAGRHLRNLKIASDDAWEGAKVSTEKIWTEFTALFQASAKTP